MLLLFATDIRQYKEVKKILADFEQWKGCEKVSRCSSDAMLPPDRIPQPPKTSVTAQGSRYIVF